MSLDKAGVDTALASGATGRFGERVVDLICSGPEGNPLAGVVLESGERIAAKWVFGADGRGSTVAGRLGLRKERPLRGELAFLFAYWTGLPNDGHAAMHINPERILSGWPVEDGAEMVSDVVVAPESLMRGFFRRPTGPGWALVGDAGHFKHPGTAQGIADAVEQAVYIADSLSGGWSRLGR
jgi:2-polyprenyl-6-methoxyphenol hydroxylase-like FAD-dependent oxidoreductase